MLARLIVLFTFITLFTSTFVVHAASLNLTHIGSLATNGSMYSEWWYTGTNPVFKGVSGTSTSVKITLNDSSQDLTSDSEGAWSYSSTLDYGDHNVKVESGGESYSFKLHLTQTLPETFGSTTVETSQSTVVPDTGSNTLIAGTSGLMLLAIGASYFKKTQSKKQIEASIKNSA